MADSIREAAMKKFCELMATQTQGQPTSDPYDFTWSRVSRTPLGDLDSRKRFACSLLEGTELPIDRTEPCIHKRLRVTIEFRALLNSDEDPAECANMILTNIQRRVQSDPRLAVVNGGQPLVIDIEETGSDLDVESFADRTVEGAVFFVVKYKHRGDDPRVVA